MRKAVLAIGVGLVLVGSRADAGEPVRVRVLSYNIQGGRGPRLSLPRLAQVIAGQQPDLVALQEVDVRTTRAQGVDQAAELARLTGLHVAFGAAMPYAGGEYGCAVLSRFPILRAQTHALPAAGKSEPRCGVAVAVAVPGLGTNLLFCGTHLDNLSEALRVQQLQRLQTALGSPGAPAILAGDLNAEPGSPTLTALAPPWLCVTTNLPSATWPADQPRQRIDHVFCRPADRFRVVSAVVVDEREASDHRPVLVVFEWVVP